MAHKRVYATAEGARVLRRPAGHYGTRMLTAGDEMTVDAPKARLLTKMGWADEARPKRAKPQLDHDGDGKAGGSPHPTGAELPALRAAYQEKFGKKPFNGWDAATLREKIAAA
jgi:hypothetical protein